MGKGKKTLRKKKPLRHRGHGDSLRRIRLRIERKRNIKEKEPLRHRGHGDSLRRIRWIYREF